MVLNSDGQPQANAVVYLQDQKTLEVRTFITEADGHYRFGQLASDVDYQLWAEFKGRKSKTRAISSFDSKKQFNFDLKIETPSRPKAACEHYSLLVFQALPVDQVTQRRGGA